MQTILVVDDDSFFLELITTNLHDYQVETATSAEQASEIYQQRSFDLVILDIKLGDVDGYHLCTQLRHQDTETPILFISSLTDLDSRLKAYGAGGSDYISKPYQAKELKYKVEHLISSHKQAKQLAQQLTDHSALLTDIQKEASYLQAVNRFAQVSHQCHDPETLLQVFFVTLKALGTSGVINTRGANQLTQSDDGQISRLEDEILSMCRSLPKVHSFGKNRAIFNWPNATLLIRKVDNLADIIAILMDSLELALKSIKLESSLAQQINYIEAANNDCQEHIQSLIKDMTVALQDSLVTLGIVSSLGDEEEEQINGIVQYYSEQIQNKLHEQDQYSLQIRELLDQLRSTSEEVTILLNQSTEEQQDADLELF